jgi:antitoxin PrlF
VITSKLSSKAQTTIPQAVRTALGVKEGDELDYAIEDGRVVMTKAPPKLPKKGDPLEDPFAAFWEWDSEEDERAFADFGRARTVPQGSAFAVWDVVRVAFPYADRSVARRRPASVVAAPEVHARFAWPGDVAIFGLSEAGLAVPCFVRTEKIATVDARFVEAVGRLVPGDRAKVIESLRNLLAPALAPGH